MDIIVPLKVQIDTATCTATSRPLEAPISTSSPTSQHTCNSPPPPDPSKNTSTYWTTRTTWLQIIDIPAKSAHFVRISTPYPDNNVCFEPGTNLPLCISSSPTVASGPAIWTALRNHNPEPITLRYGHCMGMTEMVAIVLQPSSATSALPTKWPPFLAHLTPLQQQQLIALLEQYMNIFSCSGEDIGATQGPPVH